jgi:hypothetical protein
MPLLEIIQTRYVSATIRLDETTAAQVDQYAAFVHASADDVVNRALSYVFSKDRDFQDFLRTPDAGRAPSLLRVRRVVAGDGIRQPEANTNEAAETPRPKPNSTTQTPAIERGSKS